ncbi:hypothetical protein [Haloprofundus salilacus]|uniref:hypothetical protein n=1 Tax=Haloprofundus salilacus TaxID=2876190 RepID=UPI001CCF61CC|nr:hypothetical protein [Haloprofundus salilacus]
MGDDSRLTVDRRTVLSALASLSAVGAAGCSTLERGTDTQTAEVDAEPARELATKFAPTVYFDVNEPWFPTDPRPYTTERDGETIVDGFDALDGYHEQYDGQSPPNPTVFYNAVEYENSSLTVIQFWFYSVFDQFTTNFHWHDWEVLHVFVDTETGDPQLYVASSHSRKVPNNEFLDPDPEVIPRILSELGSHSSTLSVNDVPDRFQRVTVEDLTADITNAPIESIEDFADVSLPLAYGLPRDEGSRLPYLVPEYEGVPIYDHERLPSVTTDSLIRSELTIRSYDALTSPPTDLPTRETGLVFGPRDRDADADIEYDLVSTDEIEHIADFTGPQLSFEFAVPAAVEDAMANHITTTGAPWNQPRYPNPAADITDPRHREALAERYDAIGKPAPVHTVATRITETVTADDAPENEGLTTTETSVESVALFESEPETVPTFHGIAVIRDVPAGEHRLTVNGAGRAPYSERVVVSDDETVTAAGVNGEIPLVARERATKLEVLGEDADIALSTVALEDDFAGRLYESSVDEDDAIYVHVGGAYTTEVRDENDAIGAYRVNPSPEDTSGIRIERPETGKAPLSEFVADIAEETRVAIATRNNDSSEDDDTDRGSSNAVQGLERSLAAVVEAADRAAERARAKERGNTDRQLEVVVERLQRAENRLAEAKDDLSKPLSNAAQIRLRQANQRTEQAQNSKKL